MMTELVTVCHVDTQPNSYTVGAFLLGIGELLRRNINRPRTCIIKFQRTVTSGSRHDVPFSQAWVEPS
jgi:hypothetical protein